MIRAVRRVLPRVRPFGSARAWGPLSGPASAIVLTSICAAGCGPKGGDPAPLYEWFRFDGARTWTWASDDPSTPFERVGTLVNEDPQPDGVEVYRVDQALRCRDAAGDCLIDEGADGTPDLEATAQPPWRILVDPVSVVAVQDAGGQTFDPPVPLAPSQAMTGEVTEPVVSGGVTYTATWDGSESCPAESYWTVGATRPSCIRLIVDGQGGESPVTGTWWLAGGFGFVAYQLDVDGGAVWSLADFAAE
jgi:hypothetical protein